MRPKAEALGYLEAKARTTAVASATTTAIADPYGMTNKLQRVGAGRGLWAAFGGLDGLACARAEEDEGSAFGVRPFGAGDRGA